MSLRVMQFLAVLFTALALVPAGAHLFALPNKIGLAQGAYFTVQGIYRGWAFLGAFLFAAILVNGLLALLLRQDSRAFLYALVSTLCLVASLAIFFIWVFPGNRATDNWTASRPTGGPCGCAGNTDMRQARSCVSSLYAASPFRCWRASRGR
jgi:hypothetical protein